MHNAHGFNVFGVERVEPVSFTNHRIPLIHSTPPHEYPIYIWFIRLRASLRNWISNTFTRCIRNLGGCNSGGDHTESISATNLHYKSKSLFKENPLYSGATTFKRKQSKRNQVDSFVRQHIMCGERWTCAHGERTFIQTHACRCSQLKECRNQHEIQVHKTLFMLA